MYRCDTEMGCILKTNNPMMHTTKGKHYNSSVCHDADP